jgi:hypothetical protein
MRRQYLPDRTISARNRSERRLFSLLRRLHGAYSFIIARSRVRFKHKYVTVLQSSNSRLCLTGNIFIFIVGNQALICISPPDCRVRSAHNRQGRVRRQCNRPSHAFERYGESLGSTSARAVSPAYASPVLPQDSSFPAQCKLAYCRRHFSHSSFPISAVVQMGKHDSPCDSDMASRPSAPHAAEGENGNARACHKGLHDQGKANGDS